MKLWDKLFGKSESTDEKEKNTKLDNWDIYSPDKISAQFTSKLKGVRDVISPKTPDPKFVLDILDDSVIESLSDMVATKVISSYEDGKPHSLGLALDTPDEVYYVVSVFTFKAKSVQYGKTMHEWYEREFGGYLGYLEKLISNPPISNTPYLKTLCHIIYFITLNESLVDLCITPTSKENAANQGVILPTDILNA
jgi:hypothetical protein